MLTQDSYARAHKNNYEGLPFLRANLLLNVKKGNKDKEYKIWIWSTEFQLNRIRQTDHCFIDGTFGIVPIGYRQLINIAIIDKMTEDIIPVCWILTNSKEYQCYKYCFYHFKELITRSNKYKWELKYATVDFEKGLMGSVTKVFPEVRLIGCLFHFKQALWRAAINMGLKSKTLIKNSHSETKYDITCKIIDEVAKYSWYETKSENEYRKGLAELKQRYGKYNEHIKLIQYYENNWLSYLLDGTIYYKDLNGNMERMRANSVLEKYHAELKEGLPMNPRWEKLINFLVQKEK